MCSLMRTAMGDVHVHIEETKNADVTYHDLYVDLERDSKVMQVCVVTVHEEDGKQPFVSVCPFVDGEEATGLYCVTSGTNPDAWLPK